MTDKSKNETTSNASPEVDQQAQQQSEVQRDAQSEPEVTQNPAAQPGATRENPLPAPAQTPGAGIGSPEDQAEGGTPTAETASEQIKAGTPPMTA